MNREDILDALVEAQPLIAARCIERSCILSTNVGIRALRYFGISAKPLSVDVQIFNPTFIKLYSKGITKPDELIAGGARMIAIDLGNHNGGWGGHLMIDLDEGDLLDLSFGQFSRPQKSMPMPAVGCFKEFDPSRACTYWLNECAVKIEVVNDQTYIHAPDWKREYRDIVGQVIRAMKKTMKGEK